MVGKLRILSESKLTAIISFTSESNIWYGGYSQIGSTQTLHKHTLKRRFQQSSNKISMLHSCKTTETMPQEMHHVFWLQWRNSPVKWHNLFQLHTLKLHKLGFLSLDLALCFYEFSHFFRLSSANSIPKYKEIPGQFYPLLQWAKHINKTYMYFNLLLIISVAVKKKIKKKTTKNKYTFFNLSFHIYSVKIIGMWSNR